MNFYALAGTRANSTVLALTLDSATQSALTAMVAGLVEQVRRADQVEFAHGYRADEGEVVVVSPFDLRGGLAVLQNSADAAVLPALDPAGIDEAGVRAIAGVEWNGSRPRFIVFQRIESRFVLKRERWRLVFAQGRFVRDDRAGLEIAERIDAVLEHQTLYVVSWSKAHAILDLSMWMREATLTEMKAFLRHNRLAVGDGFNADALADTAVRRKVASITDRRVLDRCSVQSLRQYAAKFGMALEVSKGRLVLPVEKRQFKAVLGLLDEDFLSFEPTDERWVVNSKRPAE